MNIVFQISSTKNLEMSAKIWSFLYFFRFFGYSMISFNSELQVQKRFIIISVFWLVLSLAMLFEMVFSSADNIFLISKVTISDSVGVFGYTFGFVTFFLVWIHTQTVGQSDKQFLTRMERIDHILLVRFKQEMDHAKIKNRINLKVYFIAVVFLIGSIINCLNNSTIFLKSTIHTCVMNWLLAVRIIQFIIYVDLLKFRSKYLNIMLKKMVSRNTVEWKIVWVQDTNNNFHNFQQKLDDVNDILQIKQIYSIFFECIKLAEDCFGWAFLIVLVLQFVNCTSYIYWLFLEILGMDQDSYSVSGKM